MELDTFTRAYIECALWSITEISENGEMGEPLEDNYGIDDIAPDTLAEMIRDCAMFQRDNADLIHELSEPKKELAGHDFWLTRNRHGAGFWDGNWPKEVADRLTAYSHLTGSYDLMTDNGLIYGN